MHKSDANAGRCDRCEEYSAERYLYEFIGSYGPDCHFLCEFCYPKCECGSMDVEDGTDYCANCNEVIELEEKA